MGVGEMAPTPRDNCCGKLHTLNMNSRTVVPALDKLAICVACADINGIAHWWYFTSGSHSRIRKAARYQLRQFKFFMYESVELINVMCTLLIFLALNRST